MVFCWTLEVLEIEQETIRLKRNGGRDVAVTNAVIITFVLIRGRVAAKRTADIVMVEASLFCANLGCFLFVHVFFNESWVGFYSYMCFL